MCGGGGGGASTEEVETIVDEKIGTSSGTVDAPGGTMDIPTSSVDPETGEVTTGTNTVGFGGGTVAVGGTVKEDTETLLGGQSDITDQITTGFETFQPVNVTNVDTSDLAKEESMNEGFAGLTSGQEGLALGQEGLAGNQETIVNNQGVLAGNQESILSDTGNILGEVGGLGNKVGEIGENVSTGFDTVGNTLNDISGNVGERFDTVDDTLSKGFTDTSDQISTGFGDQASTLETLSSNVLGGQTSLQEYLEKVSGKQDTYFGGLSEGQANLQTGLGGLQTNFSNFENQYTDDTTLANQARADLQSQVTGGFNLVRDDISQSNNIAERQRSQIARDTQDFNQQMQSSFSSALRNIDAGVQAQSQDEVNIRNDLKQRLATIRQVILQQGSNLDPSLSTEFAKFADSFDADGNLIRSSTNNQGNVTQRALDGNNLNLATFSNTGTLVSRDSINVDEVMSAMDRLGYKGAQNNQGLMSQGAPFNSTFS